jgi:hypothetical protein
MKLKKNSSPLKLLSQSQPNFAEMILGWSPFKIVSVSAVLYPRWPPLLKIEISSNGQNCPILSQKVPKLNSISIMMSFLTYITGFFMDFELSPILTDFAGNGGHHGYRTALTDTILKGDHPRIISAKFG